MPGNPGAVAAMLATNAELRGKSRDLVRRNAWAQAGIEAFVANAVGTGIIKDGTLYVQAAAGVVADSVPELEWKETEHKARALLRAAELVEEGLE